MRRIEERCRRPLVDAAPDFLDQSIAALSVRHDDESGPRIHLAGQQTLESRVVAFVKKAMSLFDPKTDANRSS
jgi:hypothetical protein